MVAHPQIPATVPDNLMALRTAHTELAKAVGRGQPTLRDPAGHVLALNPASATPLLTAQGHNVGLNFRDDTLHITDETGVTPRNLNVGLLATKVIGPPPDAPLTQPMKVYGEIGDPGQAWNAYATLHGNVQGEIGVPGQAWNAYATLQGNSNGTHYGDVHGTVYGEIGTSNQRFNHWGDCNGTHFGNVQGVLFGEHGIAGQGWNSYITCYGDSHGTHYGAVVAPSERFLKTDIREIADVAGDLIDAVPVYRWRWRETEELYGGSDEYEHIGPMVDDLDTHAPWLVRHPDPPLNGPRGYNDRDLIGVLWGALRESRERITALETRIAALEH